MEDHIFSINELLKKQEKFKCLKRPNNKVGYSMVNSDNKRACRLQITEYVKWNRESFLDSFFNKYKLKINKIELVDISEPISQQEITYSTKPEEDQLDLIMTKIRAYRSKEISHISDKSFQGLINAGVQKCPSLRNCNYWKNILNSEFKIESNTMGSYVNPKEKIEYYLRYFKDDMRIHNGHINIRLAGDGTQVGSNLNVLNFTFGFLDKMKSTSCLDPNTVTGNFLVWTFLIQNEDQKELKIALKEILEELTLLKTIEIDGREYTIEFWLGGDLKFLALVLGMPLLSSDLK